MDGKLMLAQVIEKVIGEEAEANIDHDPKETYCSRARLTSKTILGRSAEIRTTGEWSDVTFSDPRVNVTLLHVNEEDDGGEDKEDAIAKLAVLVREYLRGNGSVEYKRGIFRKHPVLTIEADGEWKMRRHSACIPYPDEPPTSTR